MITRAYTRVAARRPVERAGAFTIVEILVVVVIIATLAGLILPRYLGKVGQAKSSVAKQKLSEIEKQVELFSIEYGRLPETLDELLDRPEDIPEEKWSQPTLRQKDLLDPWDRLFVYRYPGDNGPYDLFSLGADGQTGGDHENADILNW
jgi:general secretion pathway protein G